MNLLVLLFFVHNVVATAVIGNAFKKRMDSEVRDFGIALLLNALAFAIWTAAVIMNPGSLGLYVTIGAIPFIVSLIYMFRSGASSMSPEKRSSLTMVVAVLAVLIFIVRTYVFPSEPMFSAEGLFFFNLHPVVQVLYIFALSLAAFPAIGAVAAKLNTKYASLMKYGLGAEVAGGIILITTTDVLALNITGWVIGIVYLVLWTTVAFRKDFWPQ